MSLLKIVYTLIQFAYDRNVFIGEFFAIVKVCEVQLHGMYVDVESSYGKREFPKFVEFIDGKNSLVSMKWMTYLVVKRQQSGPTIMT